MRCFILILTFWLAVCLAMPVSTAQTSTTQRASAPAGERAIMVHYMPWFEADPLHKRWGWHWTMNHYHPERMIGAKQEAASHYTPLIGLYDSNDPDGNSSGF